MSISVQIKEEALRKELHTTRLALIKQVCTHNNADNERVDDIVSSLKLCRKFLKTVFQTLRF